MPRTKKNADSEDKVMGESSNGATISTKNYVREDSETVLEITRENGLVETLIM